MIKDAATVSDIASEEMIDSRDLIDLRAELEAWRDDEDRDANAYLMSDVVAMLNAIEAFEDAGVADWNYGETFIREDYFETYARELAEDIGSVSRDMPWPLTHIDWKAAADDLLQDYTSVEVNGWTFYAR